MARELFFHGCSSLALIGSTSFAQTIPKIHIPPKANA